MTCILALEQASPDDYVSVSSHAAGMPKVHLGVSGQVFRLGDLLYSLMLESHNDAAAIIAEHVGNCLDRGGGKRSADNSEGGEQGGRTAVCSADECEGGGDRLYGYFFITPNGLDAIMTYTDDEGNEAQRQHSTTAGDLARIMSYCITDSPKRRDFLAITRTPNYSFTDYKLGKIING